MGPLNEPTMNLPTGDLARRFVKHLAQVFDT